MEELQNRPRGLGGLLQSFHQNSLADQVQQWGSGQTAPADPNQVEQGLGGTGIIDNIAQRTGISQTMVKMGLGVAVPVLIHHLISNGHVDQQGTQVGGQPEMGGMLHLYLAESCKRELANAQTSHKLALAMVPALKSEGSFHI